MDTCFVHVRFISIVTDDFRNYDYGIAENYKRYKQKTPPSYDLKKITAPMTLFYSTNDFVTTEEVTVFHSGSHFYSQIKEKKFYTNMTK